MNNNLRACIKQVLRHSAVGIALTLPAAGPAYAQSAPPSEMFMDEVEVIATTGSYIDGAAEEAALPVQVFTIEEWAKQGSLSIIDAAKAISAVQSVLGESNQFIPPVQSSGASNINLRGLGAVRTLVLLNGRRLPPSPVVDLGVDTALIPLSAIGRIEVLKDGAAATYGSDAVGGVINFISRSGLDGLSLNGSYTGIQDSDGDYDASIAWGDVSDRYDLLVTAAYRHRSELRAVDRDFAIRPVNEAPQNGFSSFGNPGVYRAGPLAIVDPACVPLGGVAAVSALTGAPQCLFQFTQFDNLVEREERYEIYAELNSQLGGLGELHIEGFYSGHETPEENSSPSFAPVQGAGESMLNPTNAPTFRIPLSNPGLTALLPSLLPQQRAAIMASGGLFASGLEWRPFGLGGNPLTGEGKKDERRFDEFRFSTGLRGQFKGVGWDVAITYAENTRRTRTPDILVGELSQALAGFGGTRCTSTNPADAGNAAVGCFFFNPFSTGIAQNPISGAQNLPLGSGGTFVPGTVNNPDVVRGLFRNFNVKDQTSLLVADLVFDGELRLSLPGGNIGWALGAQYREDGIEFDDNDIANLQLNPCADTPVTGNTNCMLNVGPFSFFGALKELDLKDDVYGVFGELSVPLLESVQVQLAYRYEDYGGKVGSTSNPKLAIRYQATDWLALRASASSTFRGPVQNQLFEGPFTTLQFSPFAGGFRPVDTLANPNLKPEEGDNLNIGFIVELGGFRGSVDYFQINLDDPITAETGADVLAAFFGVPVPGVPPMNNCGRPGFEALQARFTFANGVCSAANVLRTSARFINGPEERVKGIDASAQYRFTNVLRGSLLFGVDATYNIEYERDNFSIEGILVPNTGPERDFVGTRGGIQTLTELRGNVFAEYSISKSNVRLTTRYIDGVKDLRAMADVGSFLTHDLVYQLSLPGNSTVTAAVFNLADRDPPFVNAELNYEQTFANPLGRSFKVAFGKKF